MAGNTFGTVFRVTTWGESHGPALGAVIDGCPPGIALSEGDIQNELDRRRPGTGSGSSSRKEGDRVRILSGTFEDTTTGTPLSLVIENTDAVSRDYEHLRTVFRPGHGDFTYYKKFGIRDHRGGGRSSGRETAARVAAGAVAKRVIAGHGICIAASTIELGGIAADTARSATKAANEFACTDTEAVAAWRKRIAEAKTEGDSLGGIVEIVVTGCPPGLGEPVFDKIDADLAKALMSIGTVKGVEMGAGFRAARLTGTECNDEILNTGFLSNNAGGILAGISTGQDMVIRIACKPIPSVEIPQRTVDIDGRETTISTTGRHDVCVIPRILSVAEAMTAIVCADHLLRREASLPFEDKKRRTNEMGHEKLLT